MAAPTAGVAANILDASLERVATKLPELLESTDTVSGLIKRSAEAIKISDKCYRVPLLKSPGQRVPCRNHRVVKKPGRSLTIPDKPW